VPRARLNVVDSSAWLAYFANESGAGHFSGAIEDTANLVVPTVCLLEVFKVIARQREEGDALQAVALMQQARVIDLDANLAILAAKASQDHKLPLADAIVYATAIRADAVVWTQDEDFEALPDVRFYPKKGRSSR
jgi:predicted nucleic acid-binding protein